MPRPSVEAERRPQILSAACAVIAQIGIPALRLSDVAKQAGVSSGTVHYYFETKRDVITAAFEFNLSDSLARRQELLSADKDSLAILHDVVESYLPADDRSRQAWKVWLALWAEGGRDEVLQEINDRLYGQWRDVVAGVIRAAQTEGLARAGDPVTLANMLIGMLDGLAVQVILQSPSMPLDSMRETCKAFIGAVIAR
ncbi:TetR family transcriptional regulator [Mycolicibacterium mageritense DSM 44476 = CIP 104973]|uniref:Fatty acid metabolism regulator protein n=2 Tax=Mycolicibacterium TaxID=1866885 RepID=A0AAI8U2G9_MYCME|nr:TetR/AcrR family transcriptional regulator [Mycolicibacterium mageritense]MBN3453880.1 TetR family transcriptional regulator [Mycobacterium sp. DSM 3803]OKH66864.1 TetR family transcriptional regulator [Mycobacterium sp. SWH-M3]MCC9182710.1 TetR family transcriptional regulator [Mycolicibacterium mageritense]TXI58255.1 MAG: TetR family transcriptional regulator [Mycolicibacterium mageritense]CDO26948.1 TetR family transcriptional regulator [Mycolicibacterium mageritense DSM 44476 = CIP 1049